jgi:hypothetical protein
MMWSNCLLIWYVMLFKQLILQLVMTDFEKMHVENLLQ